MSEKFSKPVWEGKYLRLIVETYHHYLMPSCDLINLSFKELCKKVVWIVDYSVHDANEELRAGRQWLGMEDGTVIHLWTEMSGPPLALWCYEYYALDKAVSSIEAHMVDDKHSKLYFGPITVAGDVPSEVMSTLEYLSEKYRTPIKHSKLADYCPEK